MEETFSFEAVGRNVAAKTAKSLDELENKLYDLETFNETVDSKAEAEPAVDIQDAFASDFDTDMDYAYFRQQSSINQNLGTQCELQEWSKAFQYLRVSGQHLSTPPHDVEKYESNIQEDIDRKISSNFGVLSKCTEPRAHHFDSILRLDSAETIITSGHRIGEACEFALLQFYEREEIFSMDGILEEIIAIDNIDLIDNSNSSKRNDERLEDVQSPLHSNESEAFESIRDQVWPIAVKKLGPLIRRVISVARELQIVFGEDTEEVERDSDDFDRIENFVNNDDEFSDW